MPMLNLPAIPRRTAIGHLDLVATATAPPLATIVPLRAAAPPTLVTTTSHVLHDAEQDGAGRGSRGSARRPK